VQQRYTLLKDHRWGYFFGSIWDLVPTGQHDGEVGWMRVCWRGSLAFMTQDLEKFHEADVQGKLTGPSGFGRRGFFARREAGQAGQPLDPDE